MMFQMERVKFTTKFFFGFTAILTITILAIIFYSIFETRKNAFNTGKDITSSSTASLWNVFTMKEREISNNLQKEMAVLKDQLGRMGQARIDEYSTRKTQIINGSSSTAKEIGSLVFGETVINDNTALMGSMKKLSTGELTVFQRVGDTLVRVATTLTDASGKPMTGTFLAGDSPVYKALVNGESYHGRAWVLDGWYSTRYAPIKGPEGAVIGALFIGQRILTPELRELISSTRLLGAGYFFVYDSNGLVLVHPTTEGDNIFEVPGLGDMLKNGRQGFVEYVQQGERETIYVQYFEPWDWYIAVGLTDEQMTQGVDAKLLRSGIILGLVALVLGVCITALLIRLISRPINALADNSLKVADGDYTVKFTYIARDALGNLAEAMNTMVSRTKEMLEAISVSTRDLSASSSELSGISEQMTESSGQTASMAASVASSATSVADNIYSASAAMEEASVNMSTVAAAAEEMSATIQEIAQNSERAKDIASGAVVKARESSRSVHELGEAAREINTVTATIAAISSQTNLLALNATIEAARAGEAGRGFAVVANEIKELAQETAKATEDIRQRVLGIQAVTGKTVSEINQVSAVIGDMNDIVSTIAAAVEEQSATTREIAESVGQASSGITELNSNVAKSSGQITSISKDIELVRNASDEMTSNSQHVQDSAQELEQLAKRLQELVGRFII